MLVGKPEELAPFGRLQRRQENNITIYVREIRSEGLD